MKVVKSLVLGRGFFFFFFFLVVGKTLRICKSYILVTGSTIHGRASFKRNGIILSCPMDLLLSIIEIYLPTSRTVKAVIRVTFFLSQKCLSDLEKAKLSEVNPLD